MANNAKIINQVSEEFLSSLKMPKRKTRKPVVVAMVGLIGSGKSSVAKTLAPLIGATLIGGDKIRVMLRDKKQEYNPVRSITKKAISAALKAGSNVVLDSDFIDPQKRNDFEKKLKEFKTKMVYLRTFADRDTMIERLIKAKYNPNRDLFKNSTIAIREMWRRTPHHYSWSKTGGGRFTLKKLKIPFLAEIDTTTPEWRKKVREVATKIKTL